MKRNEMGLQRGVGEKENTGAGPIFPMLVKEWLSCDIKEEGFNYSNGIKLKYILSI